MSHYSYLAVSDFRLVSDGLGQGSGCKAVWMGDLRVVDSIYRIS